MKLLEISYNLASHYKILIERGIFKKCGDIISQYCDEAEYFLITVPPVKKNYLQSLKNNFMQSSITLNAKVIRDGEQSKCQAAVNNILRYLSLHHAHRNSVLISLGGGVAGDITGYCASIYMRGIRYIHIPTSLIAQTDSSIGGKTGINSDFGKNLIGTFYQPALVIIDPDFLSTLPEIEYINGLGEVIKYGLLDKDIFHFIEHNKEKIKQRDPSCVTAMIELCCQHKANTVNRDLYDKKERVFLNLGHTVGHALEKITHYRYFKHGEAVAWGIIAACSISHQRKLLSTDAMQRVISLLDYFKLLKPLPEFSIDTLIELMFIDKKRTSNLLTFVLPNDIGTVQVVSDVAIDNLGNAFIP